MTVINPNSVAGINSITVQSGESLSVHKSDGTLIRTIVESTGISTFSSLSVGSATTTNNADKSINIGLGASISSHANNTLSLGTGGDERVRITSDGDVGIGVTNPEVDLHVKGNLLVQNTIGNHLTVRSTVSNGNDPNFRFDKGRGGGTPAIVQNGDDCGEISWRGYDGDSYETGASILCEVEGTPADGDMPMRMTFKARSAGAGSHQGRLRISADGTVSLLNNSNLQIPDKIIHDGDTDTAIRFPAADTITFETAGSERLRIRSTGGITFNGDTANANALDDYEEGDWTPKQTDGGTNYTISHAKYVKIGRLVHLTFDITSSSATNLTQIWNLPFTPADYSSWSTAYYAVNANTTGTGTAGYSNTRHGGLVVPSSGGYLHTRILGGTVTWNITNTDRLIGSATYKTTA